MDASQKVRVTLLLARAKNSTQAKDNRRRLRRRRRRRLVFFYFQCDLFVLNLLKIVKRVDSVDARASSTFKAKS